MLIIVLVRVSSGTCFLSTFPSAPSTPKHFVQASDRSHSCFPTSATNFRDERMNIIKLLKYDSMTWAVTSNITACHIHQALCLVVAGGVIQADVVEGPFGPAQVDGVEDGWRIASEDSRSTKNKKNKIPYHL